MTWVWAFVFGFGLMIGSFLNVLIHRLPRMIMAEPELTHGHETYDLCWPASHCPQCHTPLKIWHNIPLLSFVCLRGRCGFCQHPISRLYPAVELVTGAIWLACAWRWGVNATGLGWAFFTSVLLALAVIDWQTTLLPDDLTQTLVWTGLIASAAGGLPLPLDQSVWGAVTGYLSLWSVAYVFERFTGKQGMGAGDFKLLAGLGAWLGPLALIPLVLLASSAGAIVGLVLKFKGQLNEEGYIPFGPFLAAAGVLVAVVGMQPISAWMGWPFFA
jgi:leader peptidase (prepilin peptidase)/N-methyltransferase